VEWQGHSAPGRETNGCTIGRKHPPGPRSRANGGPQQGRCGRSHMPSTAQSSEKSRFRRPAPPSTALKTRGARSSLSPNHREQVAGQGSPVHPRCTRRRSSDLRFAGSSRCRHRLSRGVRPPRQGRAAGRFLRLEHQAGRGTRSATGKLAAGASPSSEVGTAGAAVQASAVIPILGGGPAARC